MIGIILLFLFLLVIGILPNSIHILLVSGILLAVSYKFKYFFKHAWIFYVVAVVLSGVTFIFYNQPYLHYMTSGIIGYGFMFVVMFAGVFPRTWTLSKNLRRNRGVFSIMSFLLITPHALLHVLEVIGVVNLFGLAAYLIMIPLTIISFKVIRKEIEPKDWFRIQKAAYVIYLLLFVHLLTVASMENKIVYAVLLTLYLNNKLYKEFVL